MQITAPVDGVVRNSHGLGELGQELAKASNTLEKGAKYQLTEIAQMTGSMQRMGDAMGHIAVHVEHAVEHADQASVQITRGQESVNRAQQEITQLAPRLKCTHSTVQVLAGQAEQIGTVLEDISSIADQTNLLALSRHRSRSRRRARPRLCRCGRRSAQPGAAHRPLHEGNQNNHRGLAARQPQSRRA
jgi:methyl-accepting chemotaxis protein